MEWLKTDFIDGINGLLGAAMLILAARFVLSF